MKNNSTNPNTGTSMTDLCPKSSAAVSSPLSQLEQPLLVRKTPVNPTPYLPQPGNLPPTGYPLEPMQDVLPPPTYNPALENRPTETYLDAPNIVKSMNFYY